jgi:hypothetical protein
MLQNSTRQLIKILFSTVIFLFIFSIVKSQDVDRFKITPEQARDMRGKNNQMTKAVIFSVADLQAILAKAAPGSEVQFQFVGKMNNGSNQMSVIVAIITAPEPEATPGSGPSIKKVGNNKRLITTSVFYDAGKICPPPSPCMIL